MGIQSAATISPQKYTLERAEAFIRSVDVARVVTYANYWDDLKIESHQDYYDRWVFAFMSIHTSWKKNVEGFLAVKKLFPNFNKPQVYRAIADSGCGLTKMRAHAVTEFHNRFWANPSAWYPKPNETMAECRDRLAASTYGIGLTKTSFVLEMAFPDCCDVVCLDTHMLQLYGCQKGTPNKSLYKEIETHWISMCNKWNLPSPMVRHVFWDQKQEKENTRYWSYVLE